MCSQAQSIKEAEEASELYLSTRAFDDFEGGDLEVADKKEALSQDLLFDRCLLTLVSMCRCAVLFWLEMK